MLIQRLQWCVGAEVADDLAESVESVLSAADQ